MSTADLDRPSRRHRPRGGGRLPRLPRLPRLGTGLVGLAVVVLGACATPDPGRTGGVSLRYERRTEPVGLAIWTVETDGTITYAGGRDAVLGRRTWSDRLDEEGLRRLGAVVEAVAEADPGQAADADGDAEVRTVLQLRTPDGRRRIVAEGDPKALVPLLEFLQDRSRVRLDPMLERLPRPTESAGSSAP